MSGTPQNGTAIGRQVEALVILEQSKRNAGSAKPLIGIPEMECQSSELPP
jgi:hypothetical protein